MTFRRLFAATGLALLLGLPAMPALAQATGRVPTVTRLVRIFLDHEQALLRAQQAGAKTEFDRLLADDFELRSASKPGTPVARAEWLAAIAARPTPDWAIEQMAAHDHGAVVVVSFLMRPPVAKAGVVPIFVVDTWAQAGEDWQLKTRYAAPVGAAAAVPGEPGISTTSQGVVKRY
jgi:hypothetical protein